MAKRTLGTIANLIIDLVDKDTADSTFKTFVENMLVLTLQEINAEVPWARWLEDEASLTATVSGTQYIVAPTDIDIDSLMSIRDETNNRKIRRISREEADLIDPGRDLAGDEILWWYQRVETTSPAYEDRIYFLYRPDSADTLKAMFGTLVPVPTTASTSVLPEKYEPYWIHGALAKVWQRLDPENISIINLNQNNFNRGISVIKRDANQSPGESNALHGHRPQADSGVAGANWPANFDIS